MFRRILTIGRSGRIPAATRSRGFSIVELMMSIVLVAIGMALALPSYRDMVEKRQVTNGAEQVAAFVNSAQGVAMKTNRVVTVSYHRDGADDWCLGATTGALACDCEETDSTQLDYCAINDQPFILNNTHAGNREILYGLSGDDDGDNAYAFDPIRGVFTNLNDSLVADLRSPSGDFRLELRVNSTGRVILCSPDDAHAIPGYQLCPVVPVAEGVSPEITSPGEEITVEPGVSS